MTIDCSVCRVAFTIKPSREKTAKYCSRPCRSVGMLGHAPYHFKGGRYLHKGYVQVLAKGHPAADRDGYVPEHRLVMEKHLGRLLSPIEVVHHKNEKRGDNRPENLELLGSQAEHMKLHRNHAG